MEPDYWHLLVLFALHTALQFSITYGLLRQLPQEALASMPLPTSLESVQQIASTLHSLIENNRSVIYSLLLTSFFYFQLWHIPLTWVFALLCGTCMPNVLVSGISTHALNILGVFCVHYLSGTFLAKRIQNSERMRANLEQIEDQVTQMGSD